MTNNSTLTIRERNILTLKAQGVPNVEIPSILHLSSGTVNLTTRFIFIKLNARNITQAVAIALEHRLIHPNGHKNPFEDG